MMVYKLPQGARFRVPGDDRVFVVGRADGACVNVRQEADPTHCFPLYAWAEVVPLEDTP